MATSWLKSLSIANNILITSADQQTSVQVQGSNADIGISVENSGTSGRKYQFLSSSGSSGLGAGNCTIYDATGSAARLSISSTGMIGIGVIPVSTVRLLLKGADTSSSNFTLVCRDGNSSDTLRVGNDGGCSIRAASWSSFSDRRIKENIRTLEYGLTELLKLKPFVFDYINGQKDEIGFIAQDVADVLPELVFEFDDGMLGLKNSLVPIIINALQEVTLRLQKIEEKLYA